MRLLAAAEMDDNLTPFPSSSKEEVFFSSSSWNSSPRLHLSFDSNTAH
jgi:hypothetical protein